MQRTFLQPITNVGVRRVMWAPYLTTGEPRRFRCLSTPRIYLFSQCQQLIKGPFHNWWYKQRRTGPWTLWGQDGYWIHLCNPRVWHLVGTQWMSDEWMCDGVYGLESLRPNVCWLGERVRWGKATRREAWGQGDGRRQDDHSSCPKSIFLTESLCNSPNNGAKMSSLPACGFSGRQPDLSPVSAQSQLPALSRTTLSTTSTGSGPQALTELQKHLQRGGKTLTPEHKRKLELPKLANVCLNVYKILL